MITKTCRWNWKLFTKIERKAMKTWVGMRARCKNPGCTFYQHYGGRGIKVCEAWENDFMAFVTDAGLPPSMDVDLDRINNDGNYEPGNVRWISHKENTKNCRSNRHVTIEIDGVQTTKLASEWADQYGIGRPTMSIRMKLGWTGRALIAPPCEKPWAEKFEINGVFKTAPEWAKIIGISPFGFRDRIKRGIKGEALMSSERMPRGPARKKKSTLDTGPLESPSVGS